MSLSTETTDTLFKCTEYIDNYQHLLVSAYPQARYTTQSKTDPIKTARKLILLLERHGQFLRDIICSESATPESVKQHESLTRQANKLLAPIKEDFEARVKAITDKRAVMDTVKDEFDRYHSYGARYQGVSEEDVKASEGRMEQTLSDTGYTAHQAVLYWEHELEYQGD